MKRTLQLITLMLTLAAMLSDSMANDNEPAVPLCLDAQTSPAQATGPGVRVRNTARCLSCHDGSVAANVNHRTSSLLQRVGIGEHPVDQDYLRAYKRNPKLLRHPSQIDPRVKLVDGKVGCTSCHDPSSTDKGMLVVANKRSTLCNACHRM